MSLVVLNVGIEQLQINLNKSQSRMNCMHLYYIHDEPVKSFNNIGFKLSQVVYTIVPSN